MGKFALLVTRRHSRGASPLFLKPDAYQLFHIQFYYVVFASQALRIPRILESHPRIDYATFTKRSGLPGLSLWVLHCYSCRRRWFQSSSDFLFMSAWPSLECHPLVKLAVHSCIFSYHLSRSIAGSSLHSCMTFWKPSARRNDCGLYRSGLIGQNLT